MEAMESGAGGLLIDEDTAATNFLIRDARMQALVPKESEPITPFIDRVTRLYREFGVSTVLVVGGSGDYLDVADTVIAMETFRPQDVTARAGAVAAANPTGRVTEDSGPFQVCLQRRPRPGSVDPRKGRRESSIRTRDVQTIQFGRGNSRPVCRGADRPLGPDAGYWGGARLRQAPLYRWASFPG